jgi:hypothetical protein
VLRPALAAFSLAALVAGACADAPTSAEQRAEQAKRAAADAGLAEDVQDFLALAAGAVGETYQVTYGSTQGDDQVDVILSQRPPDRRVDVVRGDTTDTRLVIDGASYQCQRASDQWTCAAASGGGDELAPVFDEDAIASTTRALEEAKADYDFRIETRRLLGVDATCLVTELKSGHEAAGSLGRDATLCLSPEGAALLVQRPSDEVTATAYRTDLPGDTFELPAAVAEVP